MGPQGRASHDEPTVVVCFWQRASATTVIECGRTSHTAHSMESGIYMRDGSSTEDAKAAGLSPLRLRVGVFLILLWIVPFWLLAEPIAHSLSGLSNPPSVAAVTTAIVVVQTIIGLLGFWVAGAAVKSIIKGSTMRHALGPSRPCSFMGMSEVRALSAVIRMEGIRLKGD